MSQVMQLVEKRLGRQRQGTEAGKMDSGHHSAVEQGLDHSGGLEVKRSDEIDSCFKG